MSEPKQPEGLKITDRRSFTADGELRPDVAREKTEAQKETVKAETGQQQKPPQQKQQQKKSEPRPHGKPPSSAAIGDDAAEFGSFLLNLYMTALLHLGVSPDPSIPAGPADLPAANQMVRLLENLQLKTRGNLDAQEEKLLEQILYELRLRYVEQVQKVNRGK